MLFAYDKLEDALLEINCRYALLLNHYRIHHNSEEILIPKTKWEQYYELHDYVFGYLKENHPELFL